jgi:hypothetical protein
MLPILDELRTKHAQFNPESGQPAKNFTSFFHVNSPQYFPVGSPQLCELLEAAASENVARVFRLGCGTEPLFSHMSAWYEPETTTPGGGWHRDMQYVFPEEEEEKQRVGSGSGYGGEPVARGKFSGVQIQCACLADSRHIEYVPGSHARWDTAAEYQVRKVDSFSHRFEDMPGAVRPVLGPGDAIAFTDGLHRGHYDASVPRRTLMFTLSNGPRARGLDYFSFQPYFLQPEYVSGLSSRALQFYRRYLGTYGKEMAEVAEMLAAHPQGLSAAIGELRTASISLPEAARKWHREFTGQGGGGAGPSPKL